MKSKTVELADAYMLHKGFKSGFEMARHLSVTRATVSNWKLGKSHMTPDIAFKIAEELGLNGADILCAIEQDRAVNLSHAQAWGRVRRMYIMSRTRAQFERRKRTTYPHTHMHHH
jgi:plasmid maintenance system antidote protein VapI